MKYEQIASDWVRWQEYADPDGTMTREEFLALLLEERVELLVETFGPDEDDEDEDDEGEELPEGGTER